MASRYFKLAFSTIGALGFGLVVAAVVMPQGFTGFFNPETPRPQRHAAVTGAPALTDPATAPVLTTTSLTVEDTVPKDKEMLDAMAASLKSAQDQQQAEMSSMIKTLPQNQPQTP